MSPEGRALRALVRGRVQGVNFRRYAATHARRLGLTGYVGNLPDGATVEVLAEGQEEDLVEFLRLLRQGPPAARVDGVGEQWSPAQGRYQRFEVR